MTTPLVHPQFHRAQKADRGTFVFRWLAYCAFIVGYLLLTIPRSNGMSIPILTLFPVSVALWLGPLRLMRSDSNFHWFDPAILFNTSMFYYSLKGVGLGWGDNTIYLSFVLEQDIQAIYPLVVLYVTLGLIAWNVGYSVLVAGVKRTAEKTFRVNPYANYRLQILCLLIGGTTCAYVLFSAFEDGILVFFYSNWKRGYISDPSISGNIAGYAQLLLQGFYLLPLASLVWLLANKQFSRIAQALWIPYSILVLALLMLVAPRAVLLGYLVSGLIIFHFIIRQIKSFWLFVIASVGLFYAFLVQKWRFISVGADIGNVREVFRVVTENVTPNEFVDFIVSTALIDIRLFVLIVQTYGQQLPLKYGATLQMLVGQFIPRAVWPNKPLNVGVEIARLSRPDTISGAPPGFFGEMYLNFHFLGVLLGGFALGALMGFAYKRLILSDEASLLSILVYAILSQRIIVIASNQISLAFLTVCMQISAILFTYLVTRKRRKRHSIPMAIDNRLSE